MGDSVHFRIGGTEREHITVHVGAREFPNATDYDDGNWVATSVEIAAAGFSGTFSAWMRAEEFVDFRDQVRPLYQNLSGKARFDTMEQQLGLDVEGDGKGHFQLRSGLLDKAGLGNRLTFAFKFDQTELPALIHQQLEAITDLFATGKFFRVATVVKKSTVIDEKIGSVYRAAGTMLLRNLAAVLRRAKCTGVATIFESSQRGDRLAEEFFPLARAHDGEKELPLR